jgi:flagellar FliJ protein
MRKFSFRLEKIRKYKEQLERDKKLKLATEQARLQIEIARLEQIISVRRAYFLRYGMRQPGRVNIHELIIIKRFLDKLAGDIKDQRLVVAAAEKQVAMAQKELLEATRDRKKYDKLKEHRLEDHSRGVLRVENNELDEFGARSARGERAIARNL